jgi:hypothetical protein
MPFSSYSYSRLHHHQIPEGATHSTMEKSYAKNDSVIEILVGQKKINNFWESASESLKSQQ